MDSTVIKFNLVFLVASLFMSLPVVHCLFC